MRKSLPFVHCLMMGVAFLFASAPGLFSQGSEAPDLALSKAIALEAFGDLSWFPCPDPLDFEGCHLTVLNGDPAQSNADVLFRMQPGTIAPEHWHSSAERMVLISGEMRVTYQGEEPSILKPGSYAYGPAEKPHMAECIGKEPCVLFIAFEKPVDTHVRDK